MYVKRSSDEFHAGGIVFKVADDSDDGDLRVAIRDNPIGSRVRLSLEREPSFFAGENLMGDSLAVIAREEGAASDSESLGATIGMYTCAALPVHVNGEQLHSIYLGGIRVNEFYRNKISILKNGFTSIQALIEDRDVWFTNLPNTNILARRLFEADLKDMPSLHLNGEIEVLVIATKQGKDKKNLQQLQPEDIPQLLEFYNRQASQYQFSPVLTEQWLLNLPTAKGLTINDFWIYKQNGNIKACFAVWDQSAFKQTVIKEYKSPLSYLRIPYNIIAGIKNRISLPPVGEALKQVFLSFLAIDSKQDDITVEVLRGALNKAHEKGAIAAVLGLAVGTPLLEAVKSNFNTYSYRSRIETIRWPGDSHKMLDERLPQLEISIL